MYLSHCGSPKTVGLRLTPTRPGKRQQRRPGGYDFKENTISFADILIAQSPSRPNNLYDRSDNGFSLSEQPFRTWLTPLRPTTGSVHWRDARRITAAVAGVPEVIQPVFDKIGSHSKSIDTLASIYWPSCDRRLVLGRRGGLDISVDWGGIDHNHHDWQPLGLADCHFALKLPANSWLLLLLRVICRC